jgi:hypothetical protein
MVKAMKKQMRHVARSHFVRGLSSLLEISSTKPRRRVDANPMQTLRGDMIKIGADMHRVIEREKAHEKASRKETSSAE